MPNGKGLKKHLLPWIWYAAIIYTDVWEYISTAELVRVFSNGFVPYRQLRSVVKFDIRRFF